MDVRRPSYTLEPSQQNRASISLSPFGTIKPSQRRASLTLSQVHSIWDETVLKFHSGPIDQFALSNVNPILLMSHIEMSLVSMGLQVRRVSHDPFKLKVILKAQDVSMKKKASLISGFGRAISMFPRVVIRQLRSITTFGLNNSGYDGLSKSTDYDYDLDQNEMGEDVMFNVMVHRIKNLQGLLVIDFKRIRGSIWNFKRLYTQIIPYLHPNVRH